MISDKIAKYFQKASDEASKEVEKRARKILRQNKDLKEFVMGMGIWFFTTWDDDSLHKYDKRFEPIEDLIDEWDNTLKITGEPMRFTKDSPITRNW